MRKHQNDVGPSSAADTLQWLIQLFDYLSYCSLWWFVIPNGFCEISSPSKKVLLQAYLRRSPNVQILFVMSILDQTMSRLWTVVNWLFVYDLANSNDHERCHKMMAWIMDWCRPIFRFHCTTIYVISNKTGCSYKIEITFLTKKLVPDQPREKKVSMIRNRCLGVDFPFLLPSPIIFNR